MSLLGDVAGGLLGGGAGGGGNLTSEVIGMLTSHPQGLGGLLSAFEGKGMGDLVQSWVGTGQNQPVSPDQVQQALGNDTISNMATKLGLPAGAVTTQLSQLLPGLVDKLTPGGQMPQGGLAGMGLQTILGMLTKGN